VDGGDDKEKKLKKRKGDRDEKKCFRKREKGNRMRGERKRNEQGRDPKRKRER
jgi:hypothetical protein